MSGSLLADIYAENPEQRPNLPAARLDMTLPSFGYTVDGDFRRDETLSFKLKDWDDPARETPEAAKRRILAEVETLLDQHLEEKRSLLPTDWRRAHEKRNPRHYEWLVRYQCCNETLSEIARRDQYSLSAVSEPVHDLATLLGLTLRPSSTGGRPRGAKDTQPRRRPR